MTASDLAKCEGFKPVALPAPEREITGGYSGDLLSWVMGRASTGDAWITIMSNRNIIAVASLADTACVILAEGVEPDEGVADLALDKGVNLLSSEMPAFNIAAELSKYLS